MPHHRVLVHSDAYSQFAILRVFVSKARPMRANVLMRGSSIDVRTDDIGLSRPVSRSPRFAYSYTYAYGS